MVFTTGAGSMTGRHERSSAMPAGHCRPATGNDRTALMVQISTKFQTVLAGNDGVAGLSGPSLPVAGAITGTSVGLSTAGTGNRCGTTGAQADNLSLRVELLPP